MSFVAVVTVSICFKRDRFITTVTVWAVGLPRLLRTFDDKTRVTGYLCSQRNTAAAVKLWWPWPGPPWPSEWEVAVEPDTRISLLTLPGKMSKRSRQLEPSQ